MVQGHEVNLGLDAGWVVEQRLMGIDEMAVEQCEVVVVEVLSRLGQAILE